MGHVYNDNFFDYIDPGARSSAQALIAEVLQATRPNSVVDVGCGRGVWLSEWKDAGVSDILGIDGDYVKREQLAIPADAFLPADLTQRLNPDRRFDLVQSLEVAEHLPSAVSVTFVKSLIAYGDLVLFSAAVPGQGGENHINERPLRFWQTIFADHGYAPHDCIRPGLRGNAIVEPWYRYNTILYANAAGAARLTDAATATRLPGNAKLKEMGDPMWRLRRAVVSTLPRPVVTWIAQTRASVLSKRIRSRQ